MSSQSDCPSQARGWTTRNTAEPHWMWRGGMSHRETGCPRGYHVTWKWPLLARTTRPVEPHFQRSFMTADGTGHLSIWAAFGAVMKNGDWVYKEADSPLDLALRSQQLICLRLLQLRNPRLCTHRSDPIPSLRSSPSGTDTLPSVVGEHGDLWSRDDRHQRLPLNKGTSRSKGNRLATTQSRIDLL